eukprot:1159849-Pelagomonas_calceolata.AAC.2
MEGKGREGKGRHCMKALYGKRKKSHLPDERKFLYRKILHTLEKLCRACPQRVQVHETIPNP